MYTTCLYCHGNLGVNESVEAFPVGRRVAFDARKGAAVGGLFQLPTLEPGPAE